MWPVGDPLHRAFRLLCPIVGMPGLGSVPSRHSDMVFSFGPSWGPVLPVVTSSLGFLRGVLSAVMARSPPVSASVPLALICFPWDSA